MDTKKSTYDILNEMAIEFDHRTTVSADTFFTGGHAASREEIQPESREGDQSDQGQTKRE